jgi:hypothetical protein
MEESEIRKKIADGWIRCWAAIEVLAVSKNVTKTALKKHVAKIMQERGIHIYKERWDRAVRVKNPPKGIPEAWSQVVELEFIIQNLNLLVSFVILYGPSALEILEPNDIRISIGEAQDMLNRLASLVHQYAAKGIGGIVIAGK